MSTLFGNMSNAITLDEILLILHDSGQCNDISMARKAIEDGLSLRGQPLGLQTPNSVSTDSSLFDESIFSEPLIRGSGLSDLLNEDEIPPDIPYWEQLDMVKHAAFVPSELESILVEVLDPDQEQFRITLNGKITEIFLDDLEDDSARVIILDWLQKPNPYVTLDNGGGESDPPMEDQKPTYEPKLEKAPDVILKPANPYGLDIAPAAAEQYFSKLSFREKCDLLRTVRDAEPHFRERFTLSKGHPYYTTLHYGSAEVVTCFTGGPGSGRHRGGRDLPDPYSHRSRKKADWHIQFGNHTAAHCKVCKRHSVLGGEQNPKSGSKSDFDRSFKFKYKRNMYTLLPME